MTFFDYAELLSYLLIFVESTSYDYSDFWHLVCSYNLSSNDG